MMSYDYISFDSISYPCKDYPQYPPTFAPRQPRRFTAPRTTKEKELRRIRLSYTCFDIPLWLREKLEEAVSSTNSKWDWYKDCDGCTCVSEMYWRSKYFPPCLLHDFQWATGDGGWSSNRDFYRSQQCYGMSRLVSGIRWLGVTIAWYAFSKWWKLLFCGCKKAKKSFMKKVEEKRRVPTRTGE